MADWAGHDGTATERRYREMAERQLHGISPSYERICLGVAGDPALLERLDRLPAPKRQPNLLLAAARYLDAPLDSYAGFREFALAHWDELSRLMRTRRTQTNEPRRCATLLPVLAALPQPLALLEVGAAAGLCLYPDRYAYRYRTESGELPVLGTSPVEFRCTVTGPAPLPSALPTVAWRGGLDLAPLDVCSDDDVRWLQCLVWPEQTDRSQTLTAALALAREELERGEPAPVRRGDLTTDLAALAADAPREATLVVYHSAVLAYLDGDQRAAFRQELDQLAADRPVVWLSNEGPGVVVDRPAPPGAVPFVLARDGVALAWTDPHGAALDWFAA